MRYDLIRRAGERLAQQQGAPPAEPPAEAEPPPAEAPTAEAAVDRDEPVVPLRQMVGRAPQSPPPQPEPPPQPQEQTQFSRSVSVDLARLRRAGMVTPDSASGRDIVEEFRRIKRPLLVKATDPERRRHNSHLILVASAYQGEGKSFVAQNLALSIASEASTRVLLVDADLHHPSAPQRFGFTAEAGLSDILADDSLDLSDVLLRTDIGNLSILPAGRRHPRGTELFASPRMDALIRDIARRYDDRVVVFDAPPVLASSEPTVLAMHVGQVLFVVEAEKTGRRAIEDSLALLDCCPDISFVLNKRRKWLFGEV